MPLTCSRCLRSHPRPAQEREPHAAAAQVPLHDNLGVGSQHFRQLAPDSIVSQGAGRIDVGAALAAKTLISPSELNLNDTANSNRMQRITLTNRNSEAVTYTFSSSFAQGIVTYNNARYSLASRVPLRREPDTTFDVTGRLERRDPLDDPQ